MSNIKTHWTASLLISFTLIVASPIGSTQEGARDFSVREASATGLEGAVSVVSEFDLVLSDPVEEAVNNGIPVTLVKQIAVPRSQLILKRKRVKVDQRYELRRHALSDRYLVTNMESEAVKTYPTVTDALRAIGGATVAGFDLPTDEYSDPPQVHVRVYLDIYALPTALRMRAFISRTWRHNSGWTTWNIER
jgi:hypothetical protein